MKRIAAVCFVLTLIPLVAVQAPAHPHLLKTVTVNLSPGVQATLEYITVPANETYAAQAAVGEFLSTRRAPRLKLSGEVKTATVTIPAGDYAIGVIKNGTGDYTMALYPGQIPTGEKPDASKLIKLDSLYSESMGKAEHMLIDIMPGPGKFEGKAVLVWHFGSLYLAGALA